MGSIYAQYTYVGEKDGGHVISAVWNTGGTGFFSGLMILERKDAEFNIIETIAGGDRCNGGIYQARIDESGEIIYQQNITPYDMVILGGDPDRPFLESVKAYDDLDACAACCYGTAEYKGETLNAINITPGIAEGLAAERTYAEGDAAREKQICFDNRLRLRLEDGIMRYDISGWEIFISEVEHVCLGRVEGE